MSRKLKQLFTHCRLCPRSCGVDRTVRRSGKPSRGFCGQAHMLKVAYVGPHFGEEPPISGHSGAGTVFLTGCSLGCSYCQNYQISHEDLGEEVTPEELNRRIVRMIRVHNVHNVSFVTPDHFFPHIFETIKILRDQGLMLPIVMNVSGYQSVRMLAMAEEFVDIYLPDFKYSERQLAKRLSRCPEYPEVALAALDEMVRQKGFLKVEQRGGIATKGVLVRHLILPGHVENSCRALTMLFLEFGPRLPLSIMSQYYPVRRQQHAELNRRIKIEEFERVLSHAKALGFERLYVQFPEHNSSGQGSKPPFLPDFTRSNPFD